MSGFYNYDTRGASSADQIINLERMVEERDAEIKRLHNRANRAEKERDLANAVSKERYEEIERLQQENEQLHSDIKHYKQAIALHSKTVTPWWS